jgi:hypothetical protein
MIEEPDGVERDSELATAAICATRHGRRLCARGLAETAMRIAQ